MLVCPSDVLAGEMDERFTRPDGDPAGGDDICLGWLWPSGDMGTRCASAADTSYTYLGWVLDCYGRDCGVGDLSVITAAMSVVGESDMIPANPPTDGPAQTIALIENIFADSEFITAMLAQTPGVIERFADSDVTLEGANEGLGNGGGNTIYRLREGIERFLITDINNPAASAMAQSNLPVIWDQMAVVPSAFNHIPGGANVLFMDGHVDFLRYEQNGETICNELVANILGVVAAVF